MWKAVLGEEQAPTVFVGHSMGGAVATWAADRQASEALLMTDFCLHCVKALLMSLQYLCGGTWK